MWTRCPYVGYSRVNPAITNIFWNFAQSYRVSFSCWKNPRWQLYVLVSCVQFHVVVVKIKGSPIRVVGHRSGKFRKNHVLDFFLKPRNTSIATKCNSLFFNYRPLPLKILAKVFNRCFCQNWNPCHAQSIARSATTIFVSRRVDPGYICRMYRCPVTLVAEAWEIHTKPLFVFVHQSRFWLWRLHFSSRSHVRHTVEKLWKWATSWW